MQFIHKSSTKHFIAKTKKLVKKMADNREYTVLVSLIIEKKVIISEIL